MVVEGCTGFPSCVWPSSFKKKKKRKHNPETYSVWHQRGGTLYTNNWVKSVHSTVFLHNSKLHRGLHVKCWLLCANPQILGKRPFGVSNSAVCLLTLCKRLAAVCFLSKASNSRNSLFLKGLWLP